MLADCLNKFIIFDNFIKRALSAVFLIVLGFDGLEYNTCFFSQLVTLITISQNFLNIFQIPSKNCFNTASWFFSVTS